jgi:DNA-binding transcriptional ArsR family regulator
MPAGGVPLVHRILKSSKVWVVPYAATPLYVTKAALFRTLGHPARVRILELLRDGEHSVGALQDALGLDSGGTSQHLAALRRVGVVESRREGTSVYYSAVSPEVFGLLDAGRAVITRSLQEQQVLLQQLEAE